MSDDEEYDVGAAGEAEDEVRGSSSSRSAAKSSKSAKKASASAASTHGKRKKPDVIADEDDEEGEVVEVADVADEAIATVATKPKAASVSKLSSSAAVGGAGAGAAASKPSPHAGAARAAMAANKKIATEPEATAVLLDYLNSTNRPYSALNVYDNLHGIIGKSVVPALLDKLAASGAISSKEYGKFKLYWADQSQYGDSASGDVAALQAQISAQREQLGAAKARRRELESAAAALSSSLTAEELATQLAALRASTAAAAEKLARLTSAGVKLVTPAERAAAVATLDRYRKVWGDRKRMVTDVVDSMSEGLGVKPKALLADIGIETDEDARVNIRDFASK